MRELVVAGLGHRDERLEGQMQALLRLERVLEHVIGLGHGGLGIAAPQMIIERDIGAAAALEMFQVGEGAGRLEHVMHQNVGLHGLDFVIDRRQFLIFGGDQLHCLFGDMRIARQHDRDRLADMAHFVERQNRLIVKGRAVIGLGDQLLDVGAGDDAIDAGKLFGRLRVDADDAPMRHRRAEHFAVEHARQAQMMRVVGAAGDFGADFEAGNIACRPGSSRHLPRVLTERSPHRAAQIDAQQLALIGGRAMRIGRGWKLLRPRHRRRA